MFVRVYEREREREREREMMGSEDIRMPVSSEVECIDPEMLTKPSGFVTKYGRRHIVFIMREILWEQRTWVRAYTQDRHARYQKRQNNVTMAPYYLPQITLCRTMHMWTR